MNVASRLPNPPAALAERPMQSARESVKPPFLGFGLGLRAQHYDEILGSTPPIDWFEVISENYMLPGGQPLRTLDRICERYPVVMHGVSLSIASTAPPNFGYLQGLKDLAERVEPKWISDHLCWTGVHGKNLHDLLPIPYTNEALDHVVSRVQLVQDFLGRAIVLENVSTYIQFNNSEMTEWEFLSELSRRSGCWLLFDINNVYVSAFNHGYDPLAFLNGIPPDRVVQFHMAGHSHMGTHIIDTHDHPVCEDVWDLYVAAIKRFGYVVDDASTDHTPEVMREKMAQYPGSVFHLRREKGGQGKAHTLNHGIRTILDEDWAEAVMIMDADVLFEPLTLRRMVAPSRRPRGRRRHGLREGGQPAAATCCRASSPSNTSRPRRRRDGRRTSWAGSPAWPAARSCTAART